MKTPQHRTSISRKCTDATQATGRAQTALHAQQGFTSCLRFKPRPATIGREDPAEKSVVAPLAPNTFWECWPDRALSLFQRRKFFHITFLKIEPFRGTPLGPLLSCSHIRFVAGKTE